MPAKTVGMIGGEGGGANVSWKKINTEWKQDGYTTRGRVLSLRHSPPM